VGVGVINGNSLGVILKSEGELKRLVHFFLFSCEIGSSPASRLRFVLSHFLFKKKFDIEQMGNIGFVSNV
jgi:hypothetical protein